ncbi:Uncharacterised protein [Rodentibacter pneumotropicus]|uniref:Uncharacterized protein n=1 Tax=Rodentibacter pneumotropicus TaxID=758 RepID=A0A448MPB9_9PAST|nr:Uncharacterised protein [Rodentibacter pneumotropicus]
MSDVLELKNDIAPNESREQDIEKAEEGQFVTSMPIINHDVERGKFRSLTLINWNGFLPAPLI